VVPEATTEQPAPEAPKLVQTDAQAIRDAQRLGLSGDALKVWMAATNGQRNLLKGRYHHQLKVLARKHGLNPEHFVEMGPAERDAALEEAKRKAGSAPPKESTPAPRTTSDDDPPLVRVQSFGGEIPFSSDRPQDSADVVVGPIRERPINEDLFGDRPPRTLADIYARWPIGRPGGEDFYLRVERVKPRSYMGTTVAGYLCDIHNRVINEAQFHQRFGGEEYKLQLYGPDPRGARDANGDIKIKALTDTFTILVPRRPPNLNVVPGVRTNQHVQQERAMYDHDPWGPSMPMQMGAQQQDVVTPAAATLVRTTLDFARDTFGRQQANPQVDSQYMGVVERSANSRAEQAQKYVEAQRAQWQAQIDEERRTAQALRGEIEGLRKQVADARAAGSEEAMKLVTLREQDTHEVHEHYQKELIAVRAANTAELAAVTTRHAAELARERERGNDNEKRLREQIDAERKQRGDEAQNYRTELVTVRSAEQAEATRRLAEAEKRTDERLKDLEKQHASEMRQLKSNQDVLVQTGVTKLEYELTHLKERIADKEREIGELKSKEGKSLATLHAEWEEEAAKLGYVKKEDKSEEEAPKTAWQTIAAGAADGIGKAIGNTDLPTLLSSLQGLTGLGPRGGPPGQPGQQRMPGQPPPPALGPGTPGQPQRMPPGAQGPSKRTRAWASGGVPMAPPPGSPAPPPTAPVQAPAQQPAPVAQQQPPAQPAPAQPPPMQAAGAQPQPSQEQPQAPKLPKCPFVDVLGDQTTLQVLQFCEQAINGNGLPSSGAMLVAEQSPQVAAQLVKFTSDDVLALMGEMAKLMPPVAGSPILRRDGKRWLAQFWTLLRERVASSS